jgi:hypothetical protein
MSLQRHAFEKQTGACGPATMRAMTEAFEQAWAEIAPYFSQHPAQEEMYRARLAQAVLQATQSNSTRAEDIKMKALFNRTRISRTTVTKWSRNRPPRADNFY